MDQLLAEGEVPGDPLPGKAGKYITGSDKIAINISSIQVNLGEHRRNVLHRQQRSLRSSFTRKCIRIRNISYRLNLLYRPVESREEIHLKPGLEEEEDIPGRPRIRGSYGIQQVQLQLQVQ